jgi:choline dehydrogenase-like flavoprotein
VLLRRGHAGRRWQFGRGRETMPPGLIYLLKPSEIMPRPLYRGLLAARRMVPERPRERVMVLVFFCEQPPDPDSRVTLGSRRDRLGLPHLVLDWRIGDEVVDSMRRLRGLLAERVAAAGLGQIEGDDEEIQFSDASHHMGTTRMSDDPRTGVVDRDCRVHGIDNLYLAGSSVFPTAGHANPTLSALALTHRLAAHLEERRGRG